MKAIELSLHFDDYERCSFNGTVVSFTDTDGHTLSLPVHTLTHMYNFAQFELARRDKSDSQPEALRIADELDRQFPLGTSQNFLCGEAAAELRRLHAQAAQAEAEPRLFLTEEGDDARCAECGAKLETVRPGKHQHPICSQAQPLTDEDLLRQALEALDSDHPDIQLRTAIALRERLNKKEQ